MSELVINKELKIDRKNPLVRLPVAMFNGIDKRKKRIPVKLILNDKGVLTITLDWEGLENDSN